MKPNFSKGLIPAIVIEEGTKDVLMLAYMNEEAYKNVRDEKNMVLFSFEAVVME